MCWHCWEICYCDGEGETCVSVCKRQCSLWCESVNHVLCSECKVLNSPVCNKSELQSRNGIPLHSTDSASPGHTLTQTILFLAGPSNHTSVINHTHNNLAKQTHGQWIHKTYEIPPDMETCAFPTPSDEKTVTLTATRFCPTHATENRTTNHEILCKCLVLHEWKSDWVAPSSERNLPLHNI